MYAVWLLSMENWLNLLDFWEKDTVGMQRKKLQVQPAFVEVKESNRLQRNTDFKVDSDKIVL